MLSINKKVYILISILLLAACASQLKTALQLAQADYTVYTSVATQSVNETAAIVAKARAGTITQNDVVTLGMLDQLNSALNKYAAAHNTFVATLKVWQDTGQQPVNATQQQTDLTTAFSAMLSLATQLGFKTQ